ncbi:MAG: DUF433 domain-containing protein [Aulosira sp. DedQUE10]|nr:DUF433 domain-containing protein [Aulosira sp. DedQUE10]
MIFKELEAQLISLTPQEKAQAIQILVKSLSTSFPGIEKTPGVVGGDACIVRTRIPVWTLVNYRRLGASNEEILKDFPSLHSSDLLNAWAYAEIYPEEIEQAIAENEEV